MKKIKNFVDHNLTFCYDNVYINKLIMLQFTRFRIINRFNYFRRIRLKLSSDIENYVVSANRQYNSKKDDTVLSTLFKPISIKPSPDDINVGAELTGLLNKADLLKVLSKFYQMREVKHLLSENGLDSWFILKLI